jgi:hypothetical protein
MVHKQTRTLSKEKKLGKKCFYRAVADSAKKTFEDKQLHY